MSEIPASAVAAFHHPIECVQQFSGAPSISMMVVIAIATTVVILTLLFAGAWFRLANILEHHDGNR